MSTADQSGLTIQDRINAVVAAMKQWADQQTTDNKLRFANAVATAQQTGGAPPTSYKVVTVDEALIGALESGTDTDTEHWNNIFVVNDYTPPTVTPPPVKLAPGWPIGICVQGDPTEIGSIWLALDGATIPSGSLWPPAGAPADPRGEFLKRVVPGAIGVLSSWVKVA